MFKEWYDGHNSAEAQEKFRDRALQTIAAATVQLHNFKSFQGGAPSFDEDGILQTIEPVRVYDAAAMHDRMFSDSTDEDFLFCELGPFNSAKHYFQSMLDRHRQPTHASGEAMLRILRLFISWLPNESATQKEQFVLAHPDLNLQNLLVADDGTLCALIDWDGVSMVPRSVGYSFPKWLTLDWDPNDYNYDRDIDCECENRHHSPGEMKHYRALYAQFLHKAASENKGRSDQSALNLADRTCKSILIHSIDRAATDPFSVPATVSGLVDKIAHITSQKWFKTFCDVYEGNTKHIERNDQFEALVHAEDRSSTEESSDISDPVFSSTGRRSQSSTRSSIPPSEPDKEQAVEPPFSPPVMTKINWREFQRTTSPDCSARLEEGCITCSEEKNWRRVSSLVQKASRHLQAKYKRFQATRAERIEVARPLIARDGAQAIMINAGPASSACSSSKTEENVQLELFSTATAHAIETKSFGRDGRAISAIDKTTKENTTAEQPTENYICNQGHLIEGKDAGRCDNSASSSGQSQDLLDSLQVQCQRGNDVSPTNSLSANSVQRGNNLRQRLKAKLAFYHSKKANEVRSSSPALSVESGGSRRKRILAWVRQTRQKSLGDEQISESSSNSDSTLPEIPQVSHFDMPQLDEAGSKENNKIEEINDTAGEDAINMAKPVVAGGASFPSYDDGEPVADGKLYEEGFLTADICDDLVAGTFDEARMRRLRLGFAALLSSLQFSRKSP